MGTLELIIGPMFSGKTKALISRYNEINTKNNFILVINYYKDTRYGLDSIISHDGDSIPAINISLLSIINNLFEISKTSEINHYNYILINE